MTEVGAHQEIRGRVALVTGAASGIGQAIAVALAATGATVIVTDIDERGAADVASRLPGAWAAHLDVSSREDCRSVVDAAIARAGHIDILVNNAGLQSVHPVESFPEDRWEYMIRVMLIGPFLLTRYVLPMMYERDWGRVINIASIHALVASPNKSAYVAAKHGLLGLTRAVALEAGAHGVTVNAVCPAYVRTPLVERQIEDLARTEGIPVEEVLGRVMLAQSAIRRLAEPKDVAAYVGFLCSEAGALITGSAQTIDGGWTAR